MVTSTIREKCSEGGAAGPVGGGQHKFYIRKIGKASVVKGHLKAHEGREKARHVGIWGVQWGCAWRVQGKSSGETAQEGFRVEQGL